MEELPDNSTSPEQNLTKPQLPNQETAGLQTSQQFMPNGEEKNHKRLLFIVFSAALLLFAVVGIGGFYILRGNGKQVTPVSNENLAEIAPEDEGVVLTGLEKIAFFSANDGKQIHLIDASGNNEKVINVPLLKGVPDWSADGKRIVYVCENDADEYVNNICVMDANGKSQTSILDNSSFNKNPRWLPNGQIGFLSVKDAKRKVIEGAHPLAISYDTSLLTFESYVIDASGNNLTKVSENFLGSWSRDGKKVAYTMKKDGGVDLFVMDQDGTNPKLIDSGSGISDIDWSRDGNMLAYRKIVEGRGHIFVARINEAIVTDITPELDFDTANSPRWSPDVSKILFEAMKNFEFTKNTNWDVYTMNVDGSDKQNLTDLISSDVRPRWSPDGTRIIFVSNRESSNGSGYIMGSDGTEVKKIAPEGNNLFLEWLPTHKSSR